MVGVLIIAHGALGRSLAAVAKHIYGCRLDNLVAMAIDKNADPVVRQLEAAHWIRRLDQGMGVLVLTDMLGGTPANIACQLACPGKVAVVAGVNLPMLIRALGYCRESLDIVVNKAIAGGVEGVFPITLGGNDGGS